MTRTFRLIPLVIAIVAAAACTSTKSGDATKATADGKPSEASLRDAFAQQLAANKFIKDYQRNGDEFTFSGPGAEGGTAKWRVRIESTTIEDTTDPAQPYKGNVKSAWYADGKPVTISPSGRESHLPLELTDNGLAQECYALWDKAGSKWGW